MVRLFARLTLAILANAVALWIASLLLDGFSIDGVSFLTAVLVFSGLMVILSPLMLKIALQNIPAMVGGISLVTTLVSLVITDILSDGLTISGLSTWVLAMLIVWLGSLIATVLLPLVLFKKTLGKGSGTDTPAS